MHKLYIEINRVGWIESLRAIAMLMVVVPHFIAMFCPEYFGLWQTHSILLKGINGKHGVVVFCVLTGFFSSRKSHLGVPTYLVRRYIRFSINILFVLFPFTVIHFLLSNFQIVGLTQSLLNAVNESFLFQSGINPTLWCVKDLFYGNLICFVIGNHFEMQDKRMELVLLLSVCMFLYFANVWVCICVLGAVLRLLMEMEFSDKFRRAMCALSVLAIPFLYRHEESNTTFIMQGFSCCFFIFYVYIYLEFPS